MVSADVKVFEEITPYPQPMSFLLWCSLKTSFFLTDHEAMQRARTQYLKSKDFFPKCSGILSGTREAKMLVNLSSDI